ncbi:MAG TPA: histidine phosphatase family protein, partial [Dongiaceae bacterium]
MSVEIFLLRHGETEWNLDGRLQGQLDSPLTELGRRQAQHLAGLLATTFTD